MMNEVRNIAAVGLSVFVLAGCSEQIKPTRPAPSKPVAAKPAEKPAEPVANAVAGNIAYGRVLALPFADDLANTVPSSLSIRPAGAPSIVDAGKFGSGCRLEKGATLCVPTLPMTAEGTWGLWIRPDAKQTASHARIMDANAYGFFLNGSKISIAYNDGKSIGLPGPAAWVPPAPSIPIAINR